MSFLITLERYEFGRIVYRPSKKGKAHSTIKILKSGGFETVSLAGNSHSIVTSGSRVSRAPPHHTLSTFVNLHGSF